MIRPDPVRSSSDGLHDPLREEGGSLSTSVAVLNHALSNGRVNECGGRAGALRRDSSATGTPVPTSILGVVPGGEAGSTAVKEEEPIEQMETTMTQEEKNSSRSEEAVKEEHNNVQGGHENWREGETAEEYKVREPTYTKTNSLSFHTLCGRFEKLWTQRKKNSDRVSKESRLQYLLPPKLKKFLGNDSPFPMLRLVMPEIDTSRPHNGMKEKTIGVAWAEAIGLSKGSRAYEKLIKFNDPTVAGPTAAGDLSVAVLEVMEERFSNKKSNVTVGQMNELLDQLADIKNFTASAAANDAPGSSRAGGGNGRSYAKKQRQRVRWVEKLIGLNLSPLEHKWVVRILLQKLEIGIGWKSILKYYSQYADELYSANNSLKSLCATLSDPEWVRRRKEREENQKKAIHDHNRKNHIPTSVEPATLGNTLAPMLAHRTSFASVLGDLGTRHRALRESLASDDMGASSLALKFPTFVCEVKLDGERMLVHMNRGIVTMQTRNATWYSHVYSPILGPALRRTISKYDVDVILDGEVIAWDDARKEVIPFGANRSVAKVRREWCQRHGKFDEKDLNLHGDGDDVNVMSIAMSNAFDAKSPVELNLEDGVEPGSVCWLKFVVFDILYVRGPGCTDLKSKCKFSMDIPLAGSIINLDGYHRKTILHTLIEPQENEVELVDALVVRSDGTSVSAAEYFSPVQPKEFGHEAAHLDSIYFALEGTIPNLESIDEKRRARRTDENIDQERAYSVEQFYSEVVERQYQEGLVFKDLATPYMMGDQSRTAGYWFKLKADYEKLGHASDIDVVVLGAFYASGMKNSGLLNHFLLGCVDPEAPGKFMTLCKVSGGGTARKNLDRVFESTGFKGGSETRSVRYGKWFKAANHGRSLPDFISQRSYQRSMGGDDQGWKFDRSTKYPDLWIQPEDSFVLTINAGEIVSSDSFSAGVTLRFPRIAHIRAEGFEHGAKSPFEVESVTSLHQLYFERQSQIRGSYTESGSQGSSSFLSERGVIPQQCRFLTWDQNTSKKRSLKKSRATDKSSDEVRASRIPSKVSVESRALQGHTFTVLEGTYKMEGKSLDFEEAAEQGWFDEAAKVKSRQDVINFILGHGGKCELTGHCDTDFILGGEVTDARVSNHRRAMEAASSDNLNDTTKKGLNLRRMIQMGGVLKWTYVFSVINRWEKAQQDTEKSGTEPKSTDLSQQTIKENASHLLHPRRHDFLALSKLAEETLSATEDKYGAHLWKDSNIIDFKRALDEVGRTKRASKRSKLRKHMQTASANHSDSVQWQYRAYMSLDDHERHVFAGQHQCLWPYHSETVSLNERTCSQIVMYADLFPGLGFSSSEQALEESQTTAKSCQCRWDEIAPEKLFGVVASSLPLARAMGAQVTPHLHNGVTHILCDMKNQDAVEWRESLPQKLFSDKEICSSIHHRLLEFLEEQNRSEKQRHPVIFVSPNWLRKKWKESL